MHRFYLPPSSTEGGTLWLSGREAHHALRVLRLRPGLGVVVLDGAGHELHCEIEECARDRVRLRVIEKLCVPAPASAVTLLQAVPKGKTFEAIIQKAVELGAARIVPLRSERVVVQFGGEDRASRAEKWQGVAIEAIKQCGAAWLPQVAAPITPRQFLARDEPFDLALVASLQDDSKHPREYFRAFHTQHRRAPKSVCVWVGPEGDFTSGELDAIKAGGALPITLGRLVLRSETAAFYCLSILNYELQGMDVEALKR